MVEETANGLIPSARGDDDSVHLDILSLQGGAVAPGETTEGPRRKRQYLHTIGGVRGNAVVRREPAFLREVLEGS